MPEPDGWWVPGAFVDTDERRVRLRPPLDWRRDMIDVPRVPPSMNANEIRSHWRGFHNQKRSWQEEIGLMLLQAKVPRRNERAIAGLILRFPVANKRRDPSNFAGLVNKALGDALVISADTPVEIRFIPDDDAEHYVFGGAEIETEAGPPRTRIVLFTQPRNADG